jgi:hypothetical protein
LEEREERAEGAAEEDDVVAVVDWLCEGVFVRIQTREDLAEDGGRGCAFCGLVVAVEFEKFGV